MPEAYIHRCVAQAALEKSGFQPPQSLAPYYMGANGPDVLFTYRVLSHHKPYDLEQLGTRMHDEQCGRFLRTLIFSAHTPAQMNYALGFVTHYAADSVMHPYIEFQSSEAGQFPMPYGHGFCEVALDSMFHEQRCGTPGVPVQDAAAKLSPREMAEITRLVHDALLEVYGEDIPPEALADAMHSFYQLHCAFCSKHGFLRAVMWCTERMILHRPGFGMCHMTPAKQPQGGFVCEWEHPFTHAHMTAGPQQLYEQSQALAEQYLRAVGAYWLGQKSKAELAAQLGDKSYSTGLMSDPAPSPERAGQACGAGLACGENG